MKKKDAGDFEEIASRSSDENLLAELWDFLRQSKKWWMLPILAVLLLYGLLILFYGTAAAPFLYTLF
jgi:hypothetical protein